MQRAAGGREIDVTAVVLVQAGTSALAVRQGVRMSPKGHAGGGPHRPGSCSMGWASRGSEGLMLAQRRARQALERDQFQGKKTAWNHRWSFLVLPSSRQNMNEKKFLELGEEFLEARVIPEEGREETGLPVTDSLQAGSCHREAALLCSEFEQRRSAT